jgi:hypothetical protein
MTLKSVIGVSPAGGAVLWEHPFEGGSGGPMPVADRGTIIVGVMNAGVMAIIRRANGREQISIDSPSAPFLRNGVAGSTSGGLSRRNRAASDCCA